MNKMKKQEKGITLLALIITIIVLLILAVVAIKEVQGDGIIVHVKEGTIRHQIAQVEEGLKIKLNEEKIVINTQENPSEEDVYYTSLLTELMSMQEYKVGSLYNKDTSELIVSNLRWLPTDLIFDKDENLEGLDLKIKVNIGNGGYMSGITDISQIKRPKDMFLIDNDYNIYYIDAKGEVVYSSKQTYRLNEDSILSQGSYINPDNLAGKDKEVYEGIYNGALAFTGDEEYARYLASNDINLSSDIDTFVMGGYYQLDILKNNQIVELEDGTKLENVVLLQTEPNWEYIQIVNDPVSYFMDNNYNMYKIVNNDRNNTKIYDKDGKLLAEGVKTQASEEVLKELTTADGSKYQYMERFDQKDIYIINIPDKETIDMKTDLADFRIYTVSQDLVLNTIKTIRFSDNIRNLDGLGSLYNYGFPFRSVLPNIEYVELPNNMQRICGETFKDCKKLKTVIMPDNIETIAENAFSGCDGVTVKFKDGKAPLGAPWGGTNIIVGNK